MLLLVAIFLFSHHFFTLIYEKNDGKNINMKKKMILLQVPMLEATEQRYGLNKGYVLNFSLRQVL